MTRLTCRGIVLKHKDNTLTIKLSQDSDTNRIKFIHT